jgi:hypothetical protein
MYGPDEYIPNTKKKERDYPIGYVRWTEGRNMEAFIDLLAEGKVKNSPNDLSSNSDCGRRKSI